MQPSHYLKSYSSKDSPDQLLLFSTKKASVILLDKETFQAMQEGTLSPSDEATLEKVGMIVPDRDREKQAMLAFLDDKNPQNRMLNVIAVLNLDCNFACPYCFEEGVKGNLYMMEATASRLLAFIRDKWRDHKDKLIIDFYGGEPLLSLDLIQSISKAAKSFAESRGAVYSFTLVTNGSLFTGKVADALVPLGLKSVKITLDGPAEIHNQYRPFKSGAGSFDTIIKNIKAACDRAKIGIGGNFTRDNYKKFALLLDYLQDAGLTPDKLSSVKFDAVVNRPKNDAAPGDYAGGCISINEPWLLEAEAFLREEILKRGYKTSKPIPMACMVETTDSYVVNYDGVLYKCPAFIGKKGFAVGDLESGVGDYSETLKLGIYKNRDCAECVYLPLCFGGCRYMAYVRDGNINKLDCKKEYFDAALETLLKQDIRYRFQK
ncbi:MAG: geopeptide radical SAM maturase [Deltaproteobacteria bacterium]|nr:geopeptide radical SAM maturase [Deltaproteobacteria bacterium]